MPAFKDLPRADKLEILYGPIVAVVKHQGAPDKSYNVRSKEGVLSCSCQVWMTSTQQPRTCRHTAAVKRNLDSKSGMRDRAVLICEELLEVIGQTVTPGALQRMAGALRPYLGLDVAQTPSAAKHHNRVLVGGARLITLED